MTLAAWVVYRKLGLGLLRTAWFNLDWAWAAALVATGVVVPVELATASSLGTGGCNAPIRNPVHSEPGLQHGTSRPSPVCRVDVPAENGRLRGRAGARPSKRVALSGAVRGVVVGHGLSDTQSLRRRLQLLRVPASPAPARCRACASTLRASHGRDGRAGNRCRLALGRNGDGLGPRRTFPRSERCRSSWAESAPRRICISVSPGLPSGRRLCRGAPSGRGKPGPDHACVKLACRIFS